MPRGTGRSPSRTSCRASPRVAISRRASRRSGPARLRYGTSLSVALFDLDHFKRVNDTLGHAAGDVAIRRFGEILRAAVRASDVAARYGGEEFAVLFPETPARAARGVAERVRRSFENEDFVAGRRAFHATVSCGIADASGLGPDDRDQLFFRADQALYRAKDEGRNRVRLWTERKAAAAEQSRYEFADESPQRDAGLFARSARGPAASGADRRA